MQVEVLTSFLKANKWELEQKLDGNSGVSSRQSHRVAPLWSQANTCYANWPDSAHAT